MNEAFGLDLNKYLSIKENIFYQTIVKNHFSSYPITSHFSHPISSSLLPRTQYLPDHRIHKLTIHRVNLNALLLDRLIALCDLLHIYAHRVQLKVAKHHHVLLVVLDWFKERGGLRKMR
jgi:hypothetical protein